MFDSLSDRFESIFSRMRGKGRLGEKEVDEIAREIRLALLEADVNFKVVKSFIGRIKEQAAGADLSKSLSPAQQVIKIVHQELVTTLGGTTGKLTMNPKPPTVVMLVGLQGSGKTTACGKLARHLKSQGLQPLLVAADLQRPAAVTQLQVLGEQVGVPVFSEPTDPVSVARNARNEAGRLGKNVIVLDTAGRLQIDAPLMDELRRMKESVQPDNVLLVVDAMTGQEAVSVAEAFADSVGIDGVVLTKLDATPGAAPPCRSRRSPASRSSSPASARSWSTSSPSTPTGWRGGSSAWATSSRSSRRRRRASTRSRRSRRPASSARATSVWTTSWSRCSRSRRWARCRTSSACCPASPRN